MSDTLTDTSTRCGHHRGRVVEDMTESNKLDSQVDPIGG